MKKNPIRSFKIAWSVITPMLLVVLLTSCFLFSFPFGGSTSTGKPNTEDTKGSFKFLDPQTEQPFSQRLTPPATVLVEFSFNGIFPVTSIEFGAYREDDEKTWIPTSRFANTRKVQSTFSSGNNAGTFVFEATVTDLYDRMYFYSQEIQVIDTTGPTIEEFSIFSAFPYLVPEGNDESIFYLKLQDGETPINSDAYRSLINHQSRIVLNNEQISPEAFFQNLNIISSGNNMGLLFKPTLNSLSCGENSLHIFLPAFSLEETDYTSFSTSIEARFPDHEPPEVVNIDFPFGELPDNPSSEFKVLGSFDLSIEARDIADLPTYPPSGLAQIGIFLSGPSFEGTVSSIACNGLEEGIFTIHVDMNGKQDGVYNLFVAVSDQNDNLLSMEPVIFEYGEIQFEPITLLVEKITGDLLNPDFFMGETLQFQVEEDISLQTPSWFPSNLETDPTIPGLATWREVPYGTYHVSLTADHNGKSAYGSIAITVLPTPTGMDQTPPRVDLETSDPSNPFVPFKIIITDDVSLGNDPLAVFTEQPLALKFAEGGVISPIIVPEPEFLWDESNYISQFQRYTSIVFRVSMSAVPPATLTSLEESEWVELTFTVSDARNNETPAFFKFPLDLESQ